MKQSEVIRIPKPHPAQQRVLSGRRRFNVLCMGRRWGKTKLGAKLQQEIIAKGLPFGWFAPSYKLLQEPWLEAVRRFAPITRHKDSQQHRLELYGGAVLDFWTLEDPANVARGRKYARVVIDEAAMARHLEETWQQAIRPTLTDYRGDAFFKSTPKGFNYFKALYDRGADPLETDWASWQMPTVSNPYIDPAEIEAARKELPERVFAQEYLAQFLESGGGVFRNVLVMSVLKPAAPDRFHQYVMGVDWAKLTDFTVLSILDATTNKQVYLERFNKIDYHFQLQRLEAAYKLYRPLSIIAESNSMGLPLIEALQRRGLPVRPFQTTNATKAAVIEGLSLGLERAELYLLDDPVQTNELQAYEADVLPSGLTRYGAPPGAHDDTVMALALAYEGIRNRTQNPATLSAW